ncbi:MAG: hypothetical protein ACKV0T_29125 [Planctomycetales bacterium]
MSTASSTPPVVRERYYNAEGAELRLTCREGSGLVEVTLPGGKDKESAQSVEIEVLLQPRDRRGLATGPPLVVCRVTCALRPLPNGRRGGRFWLPGGLSGAMARDCHYRFVQSTIVPRQQNADSPGEDGRRDA